MVKWFIAWAGIGFLVGWKGSAIFYRTGPGGKARTMRRKSNAAQRRQASTVRSHTALCGPGKSSELSPAAQYINSPTHSRIAGPVRRKPAAGDRHGTARTT